MRRLFLFSSLLIAGLAAPLWGQAWGQTIANTAKSVNAQGDEGYWKAGQPDLMILWPQDDQNIVRRYRSQGGHPYRLWVSPDRGSGFPVVLKTRQAFDNFLLHIDRNPDKDWCEIVENPWSAWVDTGAPPTGCGALRHAQRRVCSTGAALRPCPNTCPAAEQTRVVTRTKSCPRSCSITAWSPNANTVCANKSLTQTRTAANCRGERRSVKGTKSCAKERKCRGGLLSVPTCSEVGSISVRSFSCSAGELARQHSQGCARSMSGNFRSCGWTRGSGSYYISSGRVYVTLYRAGRATLTCVRR